MSAPEEKSDKPTPRRHDVRAPRVTRSTKDSPRFRADAPAPRPPREAPRDRPPPPRDRAQPQRDRPPQAPRDRAEPPRDRAAPPRDRTEPRERDRRDDARPARDDARFFPQRPARTSQRGEAQQEPEESGEAQSSGAQPSASLVPPPTKPASKDERPASAPRAAKVSVVEAAPPPAKKQPTANEILEVASARRVSVIAPKKAKPKTARDAMRARAEAEQSKRGPAPVKKVDKKADKKPNKPAEKKREVEDDDDPPSLTKRSEEVQRSADSVPAKLGFWGRVKKLLGR